ncbi:hypothetical protein CPB83DRAFT_754982 [Crepidotus variabilis]|uniref:Golgi apparatus membrane protein TVP38 n=1 Tax=Crepidotus variabilis TaxID=179855 RepID=A0A9P6ETV8_9AGAR|nr:hypothetical protein CPB83DRAFT_754982 [Crepidotus variabilis]
MESIHQVNDLVVLTSPERKSQKYQRPASLSLEADNFINEKALPISQQSRLPVSYSPAQSSAQWTPYSYHDSPATTVDQSSQFPRHSRSLSHCNHQRRCKSSWGPYLPVIIYAITSLAFVVAITFYKTELFAFLDEQALWLRAEDNYGHAVLFFLIFLTTIPPIPLYSTFIVLSGYTFGAWTGAIISYFAALTGALVVFTVSRALLRDCIDKWLSELTGIRRVVRAIEKRPKLLFLIRLAPYPYNVMNCLLAASPTLSLHTYTFCTALSLFKVIIHTYIGASMHSFKDYHSHKASATEKSSTDVMAHFWAVFGIGLCVSILVYLSIVARRAVDEELDDGPITPRDVEETRAFLSDNDVESGLPDREGEMTEVTYPSPRQSRPSVCP